jgi:hypothetical protein
LLFFFALNVKPEEQNVPIFHNIFLAFLAQLTGILRTLFAFIGNIIIEGDGLSFNKAALKIGVDDPCCLRRRPSLLNRPGTRFFGASG